MTGPAAGSQFDVPAQMYEDMFDLPLRRHLESYTVMGLLGDLSGRKVLDLGRGTGSYSRLIRRAGAAAAVGWVSREGRKAHGAAFWEPYLRCPHAALLSCRKAAPA
ncbi:hypothetical protein AB0I81_53790 [Nonomuraea sp. NPDC050404]|uniref:hypothetical protein n=1 Tax=Nonomuraea sp. NPDC050404 TaxID=3155783 RepID=UPI00340E3D0C